MFTRPRDCRSITATCKRKSFGASEHCNSVAHGIVVSGAEPPLNVAAAINQALTRKQVGCVHFAPRGARPMVGIVWTITEAVGIVPTHEQRRPDPRTEEGWLG